MKKHAGYALLSLVFLFFSAASLPAQSRGIRVAVKTPAGKTIELYKDSYALVIGNGNYTQRGWDPLPGAVRDVKEVAEALKRNGFQVNLKLDLTRAGFDRAFTEFVYTHGRDKNNRLLFYYAGHGYTRQMATDEQLGYLVMVDAPGPEDFGNFSLRSVDMVSMVTQAKMINAKHALFMFDTCFSGTVLNTRDRITPEVISDKASLPVRQFITAGRANEPVPDYSVFKQAFLDILEGRDEELIKDGYLTGEELGLYLKNKVPAYNRDQHPQYGKIRDPKLDKGDFVFELASSGAYVDRPAAAPAKAFLSVESNVRGAEVAVDGRRVGQTPLAAIEVMPGERRIYVARPGYSPYQQRIRFEAGRTVSLAAQLTLQAPRTARLYVDTQPESARVRILNIGPAFFQGMELDPGQCQVEVSAAGYETRKIALSLEAGQDRRMDVRLQRRPELVYKGYDFEKIGREAAESEQYDFAKIGGYAGMAGKKVTNRLGMEFVYIKPGTFMMGSPSGEAGRDSDERQHRVTLTRGFYLQATEVTQAQWQAVMGRNLSSFKGDDHPVEQVSWNDVQEFIRKLNQREGGNKYRLPGEAEWEYAARAGSTSRFSFGDDEGRLGESAWYKGNSGRRTHPVA